MGDEDFDDVRPVLLGVFFGEAVLIAVARRQGHIGVAALGNDEPAWFPLDESSPRPLGPHEAWCIWKGRRLLEAFNE